MRLESVTRKVPNLKTGHIEIRNFLDEADAKTMYQAYKLNRLPSGWKAQQNLTPVKFIESLDDFIRKHYDMNWSVRYNGQPLVIVFAINAAKFAIMCDTVWWPKATTRKRLEAAAAIFREVSKTKVGLIEAEYRHKKFYETLVNHKILRRVGSLYDTLYKNSRTTFFQTRNT